MASGPKVELQMSTFAILSKRDVCGYEVNNHNNSAQANVKCRKFQQSLLQKRSAPGLCILRRRQVMIAAGKLRMLRSEAFTCGI